MIRPTFLVTLLSALVCHAGDPATVIRRSVTVEGTNDEWTNTQLKLEPGDLAIFLASGEVKVGDWLGKTTAAGKGVIDGFGIGTGTLVRKVGTGAAAAVGTANWLQAAEDAKGPLKLKVNDDGYQNNSGAYSVDTIVIPAAHLPAPITVTEDGANAPDPSAPILRLLVTIVGSNDEWTPTGVKLEVGDIVVIGASGQVNGNKPSGRALTRDLSSADALVMKTGTGTPIYVGEKALIAAKAAGALKFRVNSTKFTDNKGVFLAEVVILRARSLPPATPVKAE